MDSVENHILVQDVCGVDVLGDETVGNINVTMDFNFWFDSHLHHELFHS